MRTLRSEAGFTLLEVMIAAAIMLMAFTAILMVQNGSISTTEKARRMNTFAMLARRVMVETEQEIQGKQFTEIRDEVAGVFPEPYQKFKWSRKIKEIEFPKLNFSGEEEGKESKSSGGNAATQGSAPGLPSLDQVATQISKYFSKNLREIVVTVSFEEGKYVQSIDISQYWVNLGEEFTLGQQ